MISDASNIMNYAFLRAIGRHFGENYIGPYSGASILKRAKELAAITAKPRPDDYSGDIQLVREWAVFLGMTEWLDWIPFEQVPPNYADLV
jgi:hypothetical protein